jgi:hypothetical protein
MLIKNALLKVKNYGGDSIRDVFTKAGSFMGFSVFNSGIFID